MATIMDQPLSRATSKRHAVKVDMTPMVDLGFLLITFFIFTTSLAESSVTKLVMPKQDTGTMQVSEDKLLTILVDKQRAFVYEGDWEKAKAANGIIASTYHLQNGVGNIIRQKQQTLALKGADGELMVAIKPVATAAYQDVMNALDEMLLNGVTRYGIMSLSGDEKAFLSSQSR